MEENNNIKTLDVRKILNLLLSKKKQFFFIWGITFILSCLYILPQPRFYTCTVKLAPENSEENGGGLSSIASSFGFNIGGLGGSDAIYPTLYPSLFESPEFTTKLFAINVKSIDGDIDTNYYDYLRNHKKSNPVTYPYRKVKKWITDLFKKKKAGNGKKELNSFWLSEDEYSIMLKIQGNIACSVDKKTDVISITIKDQDPLISATLADSIMKHLQDFIILYRTKKSRLDYEYYSNLVDSAKIEYEMALKEYSDYSDTHKNASSQSTISHRNKLENEMNIKQNTYQALMTQLQATKARIQEKTPAFTTLQSATVPIKPTGPKRMLFILCMLVLSTMFTSLYFYRKYISNFGF